MRATWRSPAYTLEPNTFCSGFLLAPSGEAIGRTRDVRTCVESVLSTRSRFSSLVGSSQTRRSRRRSWIVERTEGVDVSVSLHPYYPIGRCHTKSVITKPQNVYVMRDVMCSGYVAGGNCRFFGLPAGHSKFTTSADPSDVQRSMNERLSFADDSSGEYASMLAFLSPYGEEAASSRDQVISISDRLLPWEVAKNADPEKKYFPGGERGYRAYNTQWNLGQVHFGEDVRATENMAFMSQARLASPASHRLMKDVLKPDFHLYHPLSGRAPSTTRWPSSARTGGTTPL